VLILNVVLKFGGYFAYRHACKRTAEKAPFIIQELLLPAMRILLKFQFKNILNLNTFYFTGLIILFSLSQIKYMLQDIWDIEEWLQKL